MHTETDERTLADSTAVLNGIVALLAAAGLSDKQIAAVTGCDPQQVRLLIDDAADPPAPESSVIDRARMTLEVRSER